MDSVVRTEEMTAAGDRHARLLRLSDGRRVGYGEFGDVQGLPVFAIHGTPGSRYMFALTDEAARENAVRNGVELEVVTCIGAPIADVPVEGSLRPRLPKMHEG